MNVKGKIAIVTGASSGMGLETAKLLAKKGAKVALAARSEEKLKELSKELPDSFVVKTDMRVEKNIKDMIKKVLEHYGRIDILVNNAGRGYGSPVEFIDIKQFHELFELNLVGPLVAMQTVIPVMRKQGGGTIVNISSGTTLSYMPGVGPYASLKRALNGITLTARKELEKDKIIVSVVYPYITATNFYRDGMKSSHGGHFDPGSRDDSGRPPPDSSEYIAEKIVETIETGQAEQYAHDWMKKWG